MPSLPHIEMTVAMLRDRHVGVNDSEANRWVVSPTPIAALDVGIEPDLSNAAPFLAAAAITGGSVTVPHWPGHTHQPGDAIRDVLNAFGADVDFDEHGLTVRGTNEITGVDLDLRGEGTLMSSAQKGRSDLRLASLRRDRDLVRLARDAAFEIVDPDPSLDAHPELRDELALLITDEDTEFLTRS